MSFFWRNASRKEEEEKKNFSVREEEEMRRPWWRDGQLSVLSEHSVEASFFFLFFLFFLDGWL